MQASYFQCISNYEGNLSQSNLEKSLTSGCMEKVISIRLAVNFVGHISQCGKNFDKQTGRT